MSAPAHTTEVTADLSSRLHELYHDASKHSVYQSVPAFIARALGYQEEIHSLWRSDAPRYDYLAARLNLAEDSRVADVGANTGFFSLNLAHVRPDLRVTCYELNPRHAKFIRLAAEAFALERVAVESVSCDYAGLERLPTYDAVLLLNVLHHAGFDFDSELADDNDAFTRHAEQYLGRLRHRARRLVFQIGSNRGGDKQRPLFPRDDDVQRLGWIANLLARSGWQIESLGYADLAGEAVVFRDAPPAVLAAARANAVEIPAVAEYFVQAALHRFPGEFHRRPLVIASSTVS